MVLITQMQHGNVIGVKDSYTSTPDKTRVGGINYINMLVRGGSLIETTVQVNIEWINAVVNTEAVCSVINADLVRKWGWPVSRERPRLSHAAGAQLDCLGTTRVKLMLKISKTCVTAESKLAVVKGLCCMFILGIDSIRALQRIVTPSLDSPEKIIKPV